MNEKIVQDLKQLKEARDRRDQAKAELNNMLTLFQASDEWINLCTVRAFASAEVENLESEIKTLAIESAELMTDLPEQVTVKKYKVVSITERTIDAITWCKSNFLPALSLNTKVFEKAAKDGNIHPELATVKIELRAQIDANLE